jgi:hypothetical protein
MGKEENGILAVWLYNFCKKIKLLLNQGFDRLNLPDCRLGIGNPQGGALIILAVK